MKFDQLTALDAFLLILLAILVLLCAVTSFAQSELPPTYVYRSAPDVTVQPKIDGKRSAPIYVEPLYGNPALTPQYQIVQPGTDEPPSYWIPREGGGVMVIRPGRDEDEIPAK